jgi:hypothetical protein
MHQRAHKLRLLLLQASQGRPARMQLPMTGTASAPLVRYGVYWSTSETVAG